MRSSVPVAIALAAITTTFSLTALSSDKKHDQGNQQYQANLNNNRGDPYRGKCPDYLQDSQCMYYADGYWSGRHDAKRGREHDPHDHDESKGYMKELWVDGYDKGFKDHH